MRQNRVKAFLDLAIANLRDECNLFDEIGFVSPRELLGQENSIFVDPGYGNLFAYYLEHKLIKTRTKDKEKITNYVKEQQNLLPVLY